MRKTNVEYNKRWRAKNPDAYHASQKRCYDRNPQNSYARVVRFRLYKSECKRLMNILLD